MIHTRNMLMQMAMHMPRPGRWTVVLQRDVLLITPLRVQTVDRRTGLPRAAFLLLQLTVSDLWPSRHTFSEISDFHHDTPCS